MGGNYLVQIGVNHTYQFPGVDTQLWEYVALSICFSDGQYGKLLFCASQWLGSPQCSLIYPTHELPTLLSIEHSIIHLGADIGDITLHPEDFQVELIDTQLILGPITNSDISKMTEKLQCAEACSSGCWGPGHTSCSDFIQLLHPEEPDSLKKKPTARKSGDQQFFGHDLSDIHNFAVSGWFYPEKKLESLVPYVRIQTSVCELCGMDGTCPEGCELISLAVNQENQFQACVEQASKQISCLHSRTVEIKQWHFISVSYCATSSFQLCSAVWNDTSVVCSSINLENLFLPRKEIEWPLDMLDLGNDAEDSGRLVDLRYHYGSCFTNEMGKKLLDSKKRKCISGCRMLTSTLNKLDSPSSPINADIHRSAKRQASTAHYSALTYRVTFYYYQYYYYYWGWYYSYNTYDYFTFVNNHISTISIVITADNLGSSGNPDIYVYKPYPYSHWANTASGTSTVVITPKNAVGGLTGTYTVYVYSNIRVNYSYACELRVLISCSSTTSSACFCSSGLYPTPFISVCATCPAGNVKCPLASMLGCLPWYESTYMPTSYFSCNPCYAYNRYFDSTVGLCLLCHPTCYSCVGPDSTQCTSCQSYAALTGAGGYSSCACQAKYFPSPTSANCLACSYTCYTCTSALTTSCTSCWTNASLAGGVCTCNSGYAGNANNCQPCYPSCLACTSTASYSCTSCKAPAGLSGVSPNYCICPNGDYPYPDARSCPSCYITCLTCNGGAIYQCLKCKPNAYLSYYSSPSGYCYCSNGFYPSPDSSNCLACDSTCSKCSGAGSSKCTVCLANAQLSSSSPSSCVCKNGFFPSPTSSNCQSCNATCATCSAGTSGTCMTCKTNATLVSGISPGTCQCNSGYFPSTSPANCLQCYSTCVKCVGTAASQCTQCFPNAVLQNGASPASCICADGFYPNSTSASCLACSGTCVRCSASGVNGCTACYSHARLSGASPHSCMCDNGFYPNINAASCQPCDATCKTCNGGGSNACLSCNTPATLITTPGPSSCTCPGVFLTTCVLCDVTCVTCAGNGPSYCLTCYTNAHPETPITGANPTSYCVCDDAHFPSPDASNCLSCHTTCQQCLDSTTSGCTSCFPNSTLLNNQNPSSCVCLQGFFPSSSTANCVPCDITCVLCSNASNSGCTSCSHHASLVGGTSPSSCNCDTGFFPDPDASNCQLCDSTCQSCVTNTAAGCTACFTHAVLKSGSSPSTCVCPDNFYTLTTTASCLACANTCKNCGGPTGSDCNECFPNAILGDGANAGSCACIDSYYASPNAANCIQCHSSCYQCSGAGPNACTKCYPSAHLYNSVTPSSCVCDSGYTPCPDVTSCESCDLTCKTCSGSSSADCQSCFPNAVLHNNALPSTCVCSDGFFPNPTSQNCDICSQACKTCVDSGLSDCTDCYPNASLVGGASPSSCACNDNAFPNPTADLCVLCDLSCKTCSNAGTDKCTDCFPNAAIKGGVPPSECSCMTSFYTTTTTASCQPCDSTCLNCEAGDAASCVSCFSDASLTASAPSSCACADGYFPNPTVNLCAECDVTCYKCVEISPNDCTDCFPNAGLFNGTSPGTCECFDGFFPALTSANCLPCAPTCKTCVGSTSLDCTDCYLNAGVEMLFPVGTCVCNIGFYPDPDSANCKICSATCYTCIGKEANQCSSCASFAVLSGSSPSTCECGLESYPAPDSANCHLCEVSCSSCVSGSSKECKSCKSNAFLIGPPPDSCMCSPGFYPFPDASNCSPCDGTCASCVNSRECLSCKQNATLLDAKCTCNGQFYGAPDASNCVACTGGCKTCSQTGCSHCLENYYLYQKTCLSACPFGYLPTKTLICEQTYTTPPVPSLTVANSSLLIAFDQPIFFTNITKADFTVDVSAPSGQEIEVSWVDPVFHGSDSMEIDLTFDSSYLPVNSSVVFTFLTASKFKDEDNLTISTMTLTGAFPGFGSPPSNVTSLLLTPVAQQAKAGVAGGASAGAGLSIINGNPQALISLVNQLQILSYIGMTKIKLPEDFGSTISALNMGSVFNIPYSDNVNVAEPSQQSPDHVVAYGIQTTLFYSNSQKFFGTAAAVLLSYIPIYLLSKVHNKRISAYFGSMMPSLVWSVPLNLWFTSYLDIGIFSFLQILNLSASTSDVYLSANLVAAFLFSILTISTPVLLSIFLYRNYSLLSTRSDEVFNKHWDVFLKGFKTTNPETTLVYYGVFTFRRCLFILTLTLCADSPATIMTVNCATAFSVIVIIDVHICVEGSTFLVYLIVSTFLYDLGTYADTIGQIGVWTVRGSVAFSMVVSMCKTGVMVVYLVKEFGRQVALQQRRQSLVTNAQVNKVAPETTRVSQIESLETSQ